MAELELAVLFIDGLDYDFLRRNYSSGELSNHVPLHTIFQIDGVHHSVECMDQLFAGRKLDMFQFEGLDSMPTDRRILNWDMLLSRVHRNDLLWHRLNDKGWRVGLFEMMGVFFSPRNFDGFSLTKSIMQLGLQSLYDNNLTHHPRWLGDYYEHLRRTHGYPVSLWEHPKDYRSRLPRPLEQCTSTDLERVFESCGYHETIGMAGTNLRNLLWLVEDVLERDPVQVLFLHTGYFDKLLHFYFQIPSLESEIMAVLGGFLSDVRSILRAKDVLVFSDHGMQLVTPHDVDGLVHRTHHRQNAATLFGSGPRIQCYLEQHRPHDLTAVYHGALYAAGCNGVQPTACCGDAGRVGCHLDGLMQVLLDREALLRELEKAYVELEQKLCTREEHLNAENKGSTKEG